MKKYRVKLNGKVYEMEIELVGQDDKLSSVDSTASKIVSTKKFDSPESEHADNFAPFGAVCSPMPGVVSNILFNIGDKVKKGDVVFIVEAMKMENEIAADRDGKIEEMYSSVGQSVSTAQPLFRITSED